MRELGHNNIMLVCNVAAAPRSQPLQRHRVDHRALAAQDTVTGFLLAGVGNVDLRKNTNFLVVSDSARPAPLSPRICMRS